MVNRLHIAAVHGCLFCTNIGNNRLRRNILRINNAAKIQFVDKIMESISVHLGNDLGIRNFPCMERQQHILLINTCQWNK